MADLKSEIVTNDDVEKLVDSLLEDKDTGTIIMNVALCDYETEINGISGKYAPRLETSLGQIPVILTPTKKIINKIRIQRPDIFLVGFKSTTNKTPDEQYFIALRAMKSSKQNLTFANDIVTRNRIIFI